MLLTDAQVKGFKGKAGARLTKADGNGLVRDITPAGVKSWAYRYRPKAKREKVVLGRYPDMTLKSARLERDRLAAKVAAGTSPAAEKKLVQVGLPNTPTVKEFAERYYQEQVLRNWKDPKQIRPYL